MEYIQRFSYFLITSLVTFSMESSENWLFLAPYYPTPTCCLKPDSGKKSIIYHTMVLYRLSKTCYFDFFVELHHLFGITSPFWYYITLFPVLPHPLGIIFTLFPYYLILLVLFSHFWSYCFTFLELFPHF